MTVQDKLEKKVDAGFVKKGDLRALVFHAMQWCCLPPADEC